MKNFKITSISFNKKLNAWMIATNQIIDDRNAAIFRTPNQVKTDLENSLLIGDNASPNQVRVALSNLIGSTVSGDIARYSKGDELPTRNGETVIAKGNGLRVVDGFLTFEKTDKQVRFDALVEAELSIANVFSSSLSGATNNSNDTDDEEVDETAMVNDFVEGQ